MNTHKGEKKHKNDMYGNIDSRSEEDAGVLPPIPAATVVLLRDGAQGPEVLMLKKNSKITFGGMWVFPGGKIDAEDHGDPTHDKALEFAARKAAAREANEEAGIVLVPDDLVWFAHWVPPPGPHKRFATWFFAALATEDEQNITIDDGEIKAHQWISPSAALKRHSAGEIDLVPPTWITLYHLSLREPSANVLNHFKTLEPKIYSTRVAKTEDGKRVAMWSGDAGYEDWDADISGARHRLVMAKDGFVFDNTVESY